MMKITRNLVCLAKMLFHWLKNIPDSRLVIVRFLSAYKPGLRNIEVKRRFPKRAHYKCNLDGDIKGNPGPSSATFCIKDHQGDLIFVETRRIADQKNLIVEVISLRLVQEHYIIHHLFLCVWKKILCQYKYSSHERYRT